MFTGLIQELGRVQRMVRTGSGFSLHIKARSWLTAASAKALLSMAPVSRSRLCSRMAAADVMPETMRRTSLAILKPGDLVNLELALRLQDRLGGHLVSGHIDGVGYIKRIAPEGSAQVVAITAPKNVLDLLVPQGSVAVDGISLTVVACDDEQFSVSIIPHTAAATTLLCKSPGAPVNLEADLIGKYVVRFLEQRARQSQGIGLDFLRAHGFIDHEGGR